MIQTPKLTKEQIECSENMRHMLR